MCLPHVDPSSLKLVPNAVRLGTILASLSGFSASLPLHFLKYKNSSFSAVGEPMSVLGSTLGVKVDNSELTEHVENLVIQKYYCKGFQ